MLVEELHQVTQEDKTASPMDCAQLFTKFVLALIEGYISFIPKNIVWITNKYRSKVAMGLELGSVVFA